MDWNFQREESQFVLVPEGKHRIRVKSVEKKVSSAGNDMLSFQFDVSGQSAVLFHNIVFLKDRPEITNRMLTQFFDSFKDIPTGDFNLQNWVGKVGACVVKHEEYNGNDQAKVSYFIKPEKATDLPAWQEPKRNNSESSNGPTSTAFTNVSSDMEIPF